MVTPASDSREKYPKRAPESMRSGALAAGRRGWKVFQLFGIHDGKCSCRNGLECPSPGKHPLTNTAKHGRDVASSDLRQIDAWWTRWPDANVAISTGEDSGLFVLDPDGPEGEAALATLAAECGPLPPTLEARTGRGRHLYFAFDDRLRPIKNRSAVRPGLDVRTSGGHVAAPPSRHVSGVIYKWNDWKRAPARLPDAWVTAILPKKPMPWERPRYDLPMPGGDSEAERVLAKLQAELVEGNRNEALNAATFHLAGLWQAGIADDMRDRIAALALASGLPESEVEKTVRRTWAEGVASPLSRTPRVYDPDEKEITLASREPRTSSGSSGTEADPRGPSAPVLVSAPGPRAARPAAPKRPAVEPTPLPEAARRLLGQLRNALVEAFCAAIKDPDNEPRGDFRRAGVSLAGMLVEGGLPVPLAKSLLSEVERGYKGKLEDEEEARALFSFSDAAQSTVEKRDKGWRVWGRSVLTGVVGAEAAALVAASLAQLRELGVAGTVVAPVDLEYEKIREGHEGEKRVLASVVKHLLVELAEKEKRQVSVDDLDRRMASVLCRASHCGDYVALAECPHCADAYAASTRVCETGVCSWCGPRRRQAAIRWLPEKWKETLKTTKVWGVRWTLPAMGRDAVMKLRDRVRKLIPKKLRGSVRWQPVPGMLLALTTEKEVAEIWALEADAEHRDLSSAGAVSWVARTWEKREAWLRAAVGGLARKVGDDLKTGLAKLAASGWLRDAKVSFAGGKTTAATLLPWPNPKKDLRPALAQQAENDRQHKTQSAVPDRCPLHDLKITWSGVNQRTGLVVVEKLDNAPTQLDLIRWDDHRQGSAPPSKRFREHAVGASKKSWAVERYEECCRIGDEVGAQIVARLRGPRAGMRS